jgi:hypothetical protein
MNEEIFAVLFATLLFVGIPIVYMLIKHQQKMTELLHRQAKQDPLTASDPHLLAEVSRLRDVIAQQTIAIDNLSAAQRQLESKISGEDLANRLTS